MALGQCQIFIFELKRIEQYCYLGIELRIL